MTSSVVCGAQVQLLKIYVARELQQDVPWVEEQLDVLRSILPDLVGQLHKMKATLLLGLVSNRQVTFVSKLIMRSTLVSWHALIPRHDWVGATGTQVGGCLGPYMSQLMLSSRCVWF